MKKRSKNIESIYPLSPMQEGMLFHTLYSPESSAYFDQLSGTLHGELNTNAFEQAWQQVVNRHAVLRTLFIWEKGKKPVQVVRKNVKLPWTTHDWQHLTPAVRDERLELFLEEDRKKGFVLNQAPLMRCSLIQLSDNTHQFTLSLHHLLTDGWSTPILLKEVWSFYAALCQGQHLHLPPLRPYRDYIAWLQQQDKTAAEHFWKERLQSFTMPTALRVEKNTQSESENHPEQQVQLSVATTAQLQTFAKQHHVTLNTLVQGAWALLLSRYSGEPDVVFGVTVSGRAIDLDGIDTMLGMFINTLPMRVEVQPDTLLLPWLQQLHALHLEQEAYAYTPLVEIQQWSDVPAGIPLFNNILVFENYPEDTSENKPNNTLQISDFRVIDQTNYPLTVTAEPDAKFCIRIEYDNEVFDDTTITRLLGHVQTLLEGIVTHPQRRLSELPLLTKTEYQQVVVDWNNTKADYPLDMCLHQLFEAQVTQTPEAIAVVFEEQQLTYRELNSKANQIAYYLRRVGIARNQFVGILKERGIDFLAAMLGILKAGGAFLPIDPSYPNERVRYMVTDSQIQILITRRTLFDKLANDLEEGNYLRHLLCFDGEKGELGKIYQFYNGTALANEPKNNPTHVNESTDIAYMLYTSGSTGLPKGTMVRHNGAVNHIYAEFDELAFHQNTAFLQSAPSSSDISVWQFLAPLLIGGRTVIVDFETVCDSVKLFKIIKSQQATLIELVPVVMQGVLDQVAQWPPSERALPALEWAMVTGEAVSAPLVNQWLSTYPKIKLVNAYGPTEAADDICQAVFDKPLPKEQINVPIGKPLANLSIYVLEPQQQLLPIGVYGEICVAGVGVGAGYWRNEEKTRASFVNNPYADGPYSNVIYRTGDLGRWLPDGSLEFIGRLDHQVKIRGFRIELGEIEAALGQSPFVKENAVVVHEDESTGKQLVAFCVPEPEQVIDKTELRGFLTERLPDYMIPSAFVTLEAMPLTPNGKLDRRALSTLSVSHDSSEEQLVAPRTPEEELLAGMWADVLGVERVGIHDNFFELGGHSLLAMQLISRLRDTFATELPLRDLFEFPTIANLGERLAVGRHERQLSPIKPIARTDELPLSFGQQRLWFLNQLEGPSATYNMPSVLRLVGTLHRAALEESLTEIVRRHESLRTTFTTINGKPHQVIHQSFNPIKEVVDLQALPPAKPATEVQRLAQQEAQHSFELAKGPLVRATLLKLGAEEHVLLFTMHHIISDGWSIEVAIQELSSLYNAFSQGQPSPLPALPIQYADFASWQRQWLTGEVLEAQLKYWRQQLTGVPALLELPTDYPRPASQSYQGATQEIQLTAELTQQLKKLSQQTGTTLFMTLLSAFAVLLSRYSGMNDIVIGSPIANRTQSQTESLIGFFVNTLVFRIDLEGDPNVTALLKRVRRVALDAYANQDIPFEQLVEEVQPVRSLSHSPLFQVMFVLQNVPMGSMELAGLSLTPIEPESVVAQFDLTLTMEETSLGLDGILEYSTDLFEAATMERLMGHLKILLTGMVANPRQPIHELPLLTEAEQQQLIAWNDTAADYPREKTLVDLFEEQVEKTPEAIAVVFEKQPLTYQELNIKANQLAHYLQNMGVKPDVLVGICVERSLEMVIGLFGILKAGGAYLPLDPVYPAARLAFMLEDANVSILLTQKKLVEGLPEHQARVVCLDSDWHLDSRLRKDNPVSDAMPSNLAYIIYTSGSTGKPKGVMISHQSLVNFLSTMRLRPGLSDQDILLAVTTISFDIAALELYLPLTVGAQIVLSSREVTSDGAQLLKILNQSDITVMQATPATWRLLLAAGWEKNPQLKILIGGEALPCVLAHQLLDKGAVVWNLYGPTETTIWSTIYPVENHLRSEEFHDAVESLGRPIANTQIYLLDQSQKQVPFGVPGELHIGGAGVARGYLNRPDLTAEKFIKNPFSDEPNARLYKTGDLARYLPDGNIEYLGRIDNQVKIRGFRIELGEIEAALGQSPFVKENVVVVHEDESTGKRLVAFCVPEPEQVIDKTELRGFLTERLPDYMVPSAFVTLESLPLTPNGKIDRRALSTLSVSHDSSEEQLVAPRTPEEELLAGMWAEVLGVEQVGIHDNFFELGGHSLLATQLISRLRDTFATELPLRDLFEFPTIANLGERLAVGRHERQLSTIKPIARTDELPLSFGQQRLWFLNQLEGPNATYNMPSVLRLVGTLHRAALEESLTEIVRRHESLRTTFTTINGKPHQVIHQSFNPIKEVVDLQPLAAAEQTSEILSNAQEEAQRPFALAEGPLVRATLLKLSAEEHVLLFTMHHIISDGWSIGVIIQELSSLYNAFSQGQPSPLPALPIQYVDFAHWQRQWLTGEVLEAQLNYWRQQLMGVPALLELPTDYPRPASLSYQGATQEIQLTAELTQQLKKLSQQTGTTLFMTLLSAFAVLLSRYSGMNDIVIGSPIANRTQSQTESLIGFFVNTLVFRIDLEGDPNVTALLKRVRRVALDAYANQDIPFEQLVEELQPVRSFSHSPLFQVMFVLQNVPTGSLELVGLSLTPLEPESVVAQFDLTLSMEETDQGLDGTLEYSTDLFGAATMERLMGHFKTLLTGLVANPQQPIHELPLLTEAEQQQLLAWNDTATDYPHDKTLVDLFEDQVEKTPEAIAVVFEDQQLTYRALNTKANQLAHYLQNMGVKPDILVGICVERSLEMVIGLFGILKAGGAYLPLDPAYPAARLAFMLEDAGVGMLLTQSSLIDSLPETTAPVIFQDDKTEVLSQHRSENPLSGVGPEHLAYVIYTSGSTGKSKGVPITHQNLVHSTSARFCYYSEQPKCFLLLSSFAFDSSVAGIFWTLVTGGNLVLPAQNAHQDTLQLAQLIKQHQVSHLLAIPSFYAVLLEQAERQQLVGLRTVIVAGEACSSELVKRHYERFEHLSLYNEYGPTEASVWSSVYKCLSQEPRSEVPIGRPIANTQLYILDEHQRPVPVGVPGELHIGGDGLARGYLNRPDLTAEKFIKNPFSDDPNARLYKTGDLARYLPDGNIEYLGRIDNQVKIRGFRIELGEIEAALGQYPFVKETAVIVHEDSQTDKRLVAYLVPHQGQVIENAELRGFLTERLPDYMIPPVFVTQEALPLTPNGKIDRQALSLLSVDRLKLSEDTFVAPRDALELQLAQIWEEILNVRPIGLRDNFFDLGGHSLLAVRLMVTVGRFKNNLPLAALFQGPTIEQLAALLRQDEETDALLWSPLVALQPNGSKPPFFCVPGEGGNVIYFYELARSLGQDQPFYGLQAVGLDGQSKPYTSIEEMAARYIQEIQTVQPEGPYLLGGHSFGNQVAFEMSQQLQQQGHEVALLAIIDTFAPHILSDQPGMIWEEEAQWIVDVAETIEHWLGQPLEVSSEVLQPLDADEQWNYFRERLVMANVFPPDVDMEPIRGLVGIFKANRQIRYTPPQDFFPTRIALFRASEAMEGSEEEALSEMRQEPTWGWSLFAAEPVIINVVPGDHITMLNPPHVQVLAEQLKVCFEQAVTND